MGDVRTGFTNLGHGVYINAMKRKVKHGTVNCYVNYRCRCERCRAAAAEYQRNARDRRERELKAGAA